VDFGAVVVVFVEEAVAAEADAADSGRLVGVAPLPAGVPVIQKLNIHWSSGAQPLKPEL
jgi:hypothetical protein